MLIRAPSRVLVAREPVDFRKQIDGLAALCDVVLREDPLDGTLFVFRNRRATSVKMLVWSHGGFLLLYKRLSRGTFQLPAVERDTRSVRIDNATLTALLQGVELRAPRRKWYRRGAPARC